jgi:hypothetical protein
VPAALLLDTQSHRRVLLQRRARDQVAAETGDESVPGRNEFRITIWSFKSSVSSHIRTANRFRAAGRVIQSKLFIEPFLCSYDVGERQNGAVWIAAGVSRGYRFDAIKQHCQQTVHLIGGQLADFSVLLVVSLSAFDYSARDKNPPTTVSV